MKGRRPRCGLGNRRGSMQRFVSSLVLCFALAGCFKITTRDGALTCATTTPRCPDRYYCAEDNHCWQNGHSPNGDAADMSAVAEPCSDGVKAGDETDVDCAGTCSKRCADGQGCITGNDCVSMTCNPKTGTCA